MWLSNATAAPGSRCHGPHFIRGRAEAWSDGITCLRLITRSSWLVPRFPGGSVALGREGLADRAGGEGTRFVVWWPKGLILAASHCIPLKQDKIQPCRALTQHRCKPCTRGPGLLSPACQSIVTFNQGALLVHSTFKCNSKERAPMKDSAGDWLGRNFLI